MEQALAECLAGHDTHICKHSVERLPASQLSREVSEG